MKTDPASYFAENYEEARSKFLAACKTADREVSTYDHPLKGPNGEDLAIDTCYFGPMDAERLLVITSGVHGPELMTGSGPQVGMLIEGYFKDIADDLGILLIHGANPWGSAHIRRNNEDNADLCRNFIDHNNPPAHNTNYDEVKDWLPHAFSPGDKGDTARKAMEAYKAEKGDAAFGKGFMAGQYHDPNGMSFGGSGPVWSNEILEKILRKYGAKAKRIATLDFHSGLGPYAYGTMVCLQVGDALKRAKKAYGPWILAPRDPEQAQSSEAPDVNGHTTALHERVFENRDITSVVLEFGVDSYQNTAEIMMREHRLFHDKNTSEQEMQNTRNELLRAFYPTDKYWRRAVWNHSLQVLDQSLNLLEEG